jgi:hypothetical protein
VNNYVLFVLFEQILRVIFILGLINRINHPEYLLIFGELPGVILKVILTWIYTNKAIIKVRINIWQTFVVPTLASAIFLGVGLAFNALYLQLITAFAGQALVPTIIYAFVLCFGLTLTLYPFCVGFLGGWDTRSLADLKFATYYSGPSKFFAQLFYKMTELGIKKSPLHNRFPIAVEGIDAEIQKLTQLKQQACEKEN